jgi:hypothetical protein
MVFTRAQMLMEALPLTLSLVAVALGDTLDVAVVVALLVLVAVQDQAVVEVVAEGLLMVMEGEQVYIVDVVDQEVLLVHRQEALVQGALVCPTVEDLLLVNPHKHIVAGLLVPFVLYGPETIVNSHQLV